MHKKVKQLNVVVEALEKIKRDVFLLSFSSSHIAKTARPGNFLQVKINSVILRRPFSIHKIEKDKVYILFRIRGRGTQRLAESKKGDILDVIGPLGKGFAAGGQRAEKGEKNILVAGGIGVAPLLFLASRLKVHSPCLAGRRAQSIVQGCVLLGVKNKEEILCEKEFRNLGYKVLVATENGTKGTKGTSVDLLKKKLSTMDHGLWTNVYACGPKEMFFEMSKVLKKYPQVNCQISFEQLMGCGLGVCCGCVIETKRGYKKVCKDGPVFDLRDVW